MDLRDRAAGAILGLALGDALGAPFEFRRRSEIPDPLPAFELPWMGFPPGTWTDDTAMARNLWTSLIAHDGRFEPADVLARHLAWLGSDPPDVGNQTRLALREAERGTSDPARAVFERRGPEVSAGNGSVMYCAPLGVVRALDPDRLLLEAPALSTLTHWDERCRTACLAVTRTTAALVRSDDAEAAVTDALETVADLAGGEELEFLVAEVGRSRPVDGPDMGFTLFAAAIGLRAAVDAADVASGLTAIVGLGGDTDTNAAVAGALLGARFGRAALPPAWLARLAERAAITAEADAVADLVAASA
jgi:ADP-ribosyl-[dinitrogen reductase] hydrolase